MPAPSEILKLVERFEQNRDSYMSGDYKEARIRMEFIDPFFRALGWDMNNESGYAEAYKDVIVEDSLKIGQATEAPDYCFRIGGVRKFFLEAKKPFVNIKEAISPAYQLRRYAWSSKLPLSILTDFQEFAVYDCRVKPDKRDNAATARILYFTYRDYESKWDEIASVFSREAILKGSFDKFADGVKGKRGTASVDDSFLLEIENWRVQLAKNIAGRNSELTTRELNFAVQKTIDRIIFLRICEDRGIELYGKLGSFLNGDNTYKRLLEYFRAADARYNSGLFHFQIEKNILEEPDYLTQRICIDDKVLKDILGGLYYPECPFEFSVLPADILGQVYERFLGKVIRLTAGHQAKVEEKPEVRKAGGVYYTPTYIVDYIVENTVGKLLWDFTAKTQGICDACGARVSRVGGDRVSGFGAGVSGLKTKQNESCDENVQRTSCMAESNGTCGRDIQDDIIFSKGGNVRTDKSDEKICGFHTCKYCGSAQSHGISQGNSGIAGLHGQDAHETQSITKPQTRNPGVDPGSLKLRVADIACGSGSFLIVAYQKFLDWYLMKYTENDPEKWAKGKNPRIRVSGRMGSRGSGIGDRVNTISQTQNPKPESLNPRPESLNPRPESLNPPPKNWKLTINERKRILLEHIYGVDIDSQAVEVTKLSLLLKVLEGENDEVFQGLLFQERALPDLASNIKCGNSLIGSDFYADRQADLFNEDEMIRVNAFDWESQFPEIFGKGVGHGGSGIGAKGSSTKPESINPKPDFGFDAIFGNPPYVRQETLGDEFKSYAQSHYKTFAGTADLYTYFIEKGISLLRNGGYFSYIVANKWMRANYGRPLRAWLKCQCLEEIIDFGDLPVFENATTYPCIIRIRKEKPRPEFKVSNVSSLDLISLSEHIKSISFSMKQDACDDKGWALVGKGKQTLLDKLKKAGIPLGKYVKGGIYYGIKTGLNEAFVIDAETRNRLIREDAKSAEIIKPFLAGRDIKRYQSILHDKYLILFSKGWTDLNRGNESPWIFICNKYPAIAKHIAPYEKKCKLRCDKGIYWWELRECKYYNKFLSPKIIIPCIVKNASYAFDKGSVFSNDKTSIIPTNDLYLLGILNSKVADVFIQSISSTKQGGYYEYKPMYVSQIPIPPLQESKSRNPKSESPDPKPRKLSLLVSKMLELNEKLEEASVPDTKTMLRRQIEATDREIDRLVYDLYGLTEEEVRIVEGQ